jgi:hypothetical protein
LSTEISGVSDIFGGVNENIATAAVEGALAMAGDSVDLEVVQDVAVSSGAGILLAGRDVQRSVRSGEELVAFLRLQLCASCYSCQA